MDKTANSKQHKTKPQQTTRNQTTIKSNQNQNENIQANNALKKGDHLQCKCTHA